MEQLKGTVRIGALPSVTVPGRRTGAQARYGVGEEIKIFPLQSMPPGRQGATWKVASGGGQDGVLRPIGPGQTWFTARDLAMQDFGRNATSFDAILELADAKGLLARVKLTIVGPDHCGLMKLGPRHEQGWANSGFWGQHVIGPRDVSFMNIEVKESRGTIQATGVHAFEVGTIHKVTPEWLPTSKVTANGTLLNATDRVWTPVPVTQAPAGGWETYGSRVVGTFVWDVAWMYRLKGSGDVGLQFHKAWHKATTYANGKMTVEKGGASHTSEMADPTVNYSDRCPLPLL